MPRVTFSSRVLIEFQIRGKELEARPGDPLPRTRDDGGLIANFYEWMSKRKMDHVFCTSSGGGVWIGCFDPADAEQIQEWLLNEGAERVQP